MADRSLLRIRRSLNRGPIALQEGQIRRSPFLDSVNLVINLRLRMLICTHCKQCLGTNGAVYHVRKHLQQYGAASWQAFDGRFAETLTAHPDLLQELPDPRSLDWRGPFQCLQTTELFACREPRSADGSTYEDDPCPYFTVSYDHQLRKHYSDHHKACAAPPRQHDDQARRTEFLQYVQALVPSSPQTRFYVTGPFVGEQEEGSASEKFQLARKEMQEMNTVTHGESPKSIPFWLSALKWPQHVAGYNTLDLCALVEVGKEDALAGGMHDLVHRYLKQCELLVPNAPPVLLQLLVTSDAHSE